jgi:hypothetical protein
LSAFSRSLSAAILGKQKPVLGIISFSILNQKRAKTRQKTGPGVWPAALKVFSVLMFWLLLDQAKRETPLSTYKKQTTCEKSD